jgi:hypothetical protein
MGTLPPSVDVAVDVSVDVPVDPFPDPAFQCFVLSLLTVLLNTGTTMPGRVAIEDEVRRGQGQDDVADRNTARHGPVG